MVDRRARGHYYDSRTMGRPIAGSPEAAAWAADGTQAIVVLNPQQPVVVAEVERAGRHEGFEDVPLFYEEDEKGRFVRPWQYRLLKWSRMLQVRKLHRQLAVLGRPGEIGRTYAELGVEPQQESGVRNNHLALGHVGRPLLGRSLDHAAFDDAARARVHAVFHESTATRTNRLEAIVAIMRQSKAVADRLYAAQTHYLHQIVETKKLVDRAREGHQPTLAGLHQVFDALPAGMTVGEELDIGFYGLVNPALIHVNHFRLKSVLELATFLGRANLGVISIGCQEARLFLSLVVGEGELPACNDRLRAEQNAYVREMTDRYALHPYLNDLARFCRNAAARPLGGPLVAEARLWPMR